jgi:protein-tyrosine phosphatase
MNYILEHLAVGNAADAQNAQDHFDAFLNVASEIQLEPSSFGGKPYLKVAIDDMKPIPAFRLMEAAEYIDQHINNKRILMFCDGGVGRSPSVAVAYLCSKGMRFGQAVEFVAMRKPYMSILPDLIESIRKAYVRPPAPLLRFDSFTLPSKPVQPEKITA